MQVSLRVRSGLRRIAAGALPLLSLLGCGCGAITEVSDRQEQILQRLNQMDAAQRKNKERQDQVNTALRQNLGIALGKLFCNDARVQSFLRSCNASGATVPMLNGCSDKERNSVLTFMTSQHHAVVYLPEGRGREAIIPARKAQIQQILKENRLLSTDYYVFAHPIGAVTPESVQEAEKRAGEVVEYIKDVAREMAEKKTDGSGEEIESKELKDLHLHAPKVFPYRLSGNDIEQVLRRNYQIDRPIGREPKQLNYGVWIFRTDCQAKD